MSETTHDNLAPGSRWADGSIVDGNGVTIGCASFVDGDQFVYVGREDVFVGIHKLDFCAFAAAQYGLRQTDGCARADELLAALVKAMDDHATSQAQLSGGDYEDTNDEVVDMRDIEEPRHNAFTYLREKGLIK